MEREFGDVLSGNMIGSLFSTLGTRVFFQKSEIAVHKEEWRDEMRWDEERRERKSKETFFLFSH